jgi:hypothetical protein
VRDSSILLRLPFFSISRGILDFTKLNGTGGESIYGGPFKDENLETPLDSEGYVRVFGSKCHTF